MEPDGIGADGGGWTVESTFDVADSRSPADQFLDELMPPELEWRSMVRRHPIPALLVAAGVGYWLGQSRRGAAIAEAVAGAVALGMTSRLDLLGTEDTPA